MPNPEPPDKTAAVWPPAIVLPLPVPPDPRLRKTARLAKASLWAASAGVACWVGTVAVFTLLSYMHLDNPNQDPIVYAALFLGPAFEIVGIGAGLLGKSMMVGRIGLALSLGTLCLMIVLAFGHLAVNGHEYGFGG